VNIVGVEPNDRFKRELAAAPPEMQEAAADAITRLIANPKARSLRLHSLAGLGKPTIYKIDVRANRAWQISFHLDGNIAVLRRLGTHKDIDRAP